MIALLFCFVFSLLHFSFYHKPLWPHRLFWHRAESDHLSSAFQEFLSPGSLYEALIWKLNFRIWPLQDFMKWWVIWLYLTLKTYVLNMFPVNRIGALCFSLSFILLNIHVKLLANPIHWFWRTESNWVSWFKDRLTSPGEGWGGVSRQLSRLSLTTPLASRNQVLWVTFKG